MLLKNQIETGAVLSTLNATFSSLSRILVEADQTEDHYGSVTLVLPGEGGEDVVHHKGEVVE